MHRVSKCTLQGAGVLLKTLVFKDNNKDKETALLVRHAMLTPPATSCENADA
jgi:hypothetical protein